MVTVIKGILESKTRVELICGTDLQPKPISWLWADWLAAGKFHILTGAPNTGKTAIAMNLTAIITSGGQWPDGTKCKPGNVLICSGKGDPKDTLPQLLVHGADRNRVYFVSGVFNHNRPSAFDPSRDRGRLYEKVLQIGGVSLIIIDPVNIISGDPRKDDKIRRDLQALVYLGSKLNAVVLGISHFSKATMRRKPLKRVMESIASSGPARVVLTTIKVLDKMGQPKHILVRAKSNNGPEGGGYYYQIEQAELVNHASIFSSKVVWGERVEGTAQKLLAYSTEIDENSI